MASALDGFLAMECDDKLAGWLRADAAASDGAGYSHFQLNIFDVELFYAEGRVTISDVASLGYDDVELTLAEFLARLPDVAPEPRPARPRRVIVPPPPPE